MWRYVPSTMLLAASESAVTKKPRLRLTISRSSSVKPLGFFHSSMSRCMLISCGIQLLAHAEEAVLHRLRLGVEVVHRLAGEDTAIDADRRLCAYVDN